MLILLFSMCVMSAIKKSLNSAVRNSEEHNQSTEMGIWVNSSTFGIFLAVLVWSK